MGTKLKIIRISKGLAQGYVAKQLGITQTTLSRKEGDKAKFTAEELITLCLLYGVDCRDLKD